MLTKAAPSRMLTSTTGCDHVKDSHGQKYFLLGSVANLTVLMHPAVVKVMGVRLIFILEKLQVTIAHLRGNVQPRK